MRGGNKIQKNMPFPLVFGPRPSFGVFAAPRLGWRTSTPKHTMPGPLVGGGWGKGNEAYFSLLVLAHKWPENHGALPQKKSNSFRLEMRVYSSFLGHRVY